MNARAKRTSAAGRRPRERFLAQSYRHVDLVPSGDRCSQHRPRTAGTISKKQSTLSIVFVEAIDCIARSDEPSWAGATRASRGSAPGRSKLRIVGRPEARPPPLTGRATACVDAQSNPRGRAEVCASNAAEMIRPGDARRAAAQPATRTELTLRNAAHAPDRYCMANTIVP